MQTPMRLLRNLQAELDAGNGMFDIQKFGKFGNITLHNATISGDNRWHVRFEIGAGGARTEWSHWDVSPENCMEELNNKVRKFFAGEE